MVPTRPDAHHVIYATVSLVLQGLFYGTHAVLMPISTQMLLQRGLKSRSNQLLLILICAPFVLSSAYWATKMAEQAERANSFFMRSQDQSTTNITTYAPLFDSIVSINYIFGDAIVILRCWILCKGHQYKLLFIPMALLAINALTIFSNIGVTTATLALQNCPPALYTVRRYLKFNSLVLSLLTNIVLTAVMCCKVWCCRTGINADLDRRDKMPRIANIFSFILESGSVLGLSRILALSFKYVHISIGTLDGIYFPIDVQISGMYTTMVVVIARLDYTLDAISQQPTASASTQENRAPPALQIDIREIQFTDDPDTRAHPYEKSDDC